MKMPYNDLLTPIRCYNVGIYIRLSVEDSSNSAKKGKGNPFQSESTSVENQRDILMEYVVLRGWNTYKVYADDGYSGGNFQRPAFEDMLEDAKAGLIDLILVKDLSRLGRDHIEVDSLVEDVFPSMGVRFIALMDNIDSEESADLLPFRSLMNNYYLKDLSRKIKTVIQAKAEAGEYVGTFAPYGYKKSPQHRGKLVIDPFASEVVRQIFAMRLQKMGYCKIAAALNTDGLLAPRAYCYASEGKPNPYKTGSAWSDNTVKVVLQNEVYLGHSIKMRHRSASYKRKKLVRKPENEWVRVENTHDPIITKEVWDAAQGISLINYDPAKRKPPSISLFSNLLCCADCGSAMSGYFIKSNRKSGAVTLRYYSCRLHRRTGQTECSWHTISEDALLQLLRRDIERHITEAHVDEHEILTTVQRETSLTTVEGITTDLRQVSLQLEALDKKTAQLYEDRLSGAITLDTFMSLSSDTDKERETLQSKQKVLTDALESVQVKLDDTRDWLNRIRSFLTLAEPDFDTLHELIERIEVSEAVGRGNNRKQEVKIIYRFVGHME